MAWSGSGRDLPTRSSLADASPLTRQGLNGCVSLCLRPSVFPQHLRLRHPCRTTLALLGQEVGASGVGEELIIARLADILLAQALRAFLTLAGGASPSWLAGLADPRLGEGAAGIPCRGRRRMERGTISGGSGNVPLVLCRQLSSSDRIDADGLCRALAIVPHSIRGHADRSTDRTYCRGERLAVADVLQSGIQGPFRSFATRSQVGIRSDGSLISAQ